MADFLEQMAKASRQRVKALNPEWDVAKLDRPVVPLALGRFDLIAEIKDHSPAEGALAIEGHDRAARALAYAQAGAAAISVLTEPDRFAGSLAHLEEVVDAVGHLRIPVMRKDFLVDPRQVVEARACGASGVLLITAIADDSTLDAMLKTAYELDMFVLLEAFDSADLARTRTLLEDNQHADRAAARQLLVGVNTRNLRSLEVDPERLAKLAPDLPAGATAVAESGLRTPSDTARVAVLGYTVGLVGTALMKSDDPGKLVADLLDAGRRERSA